MFLRIFGKLISTLKQLHLHLTAKSILPPRPHRNTQILEPILTPSVGVVALDEGVFTVDNTGEVEIEFLHDKGVFESEVAIFSVEGMDNLTIKDFTYEALERASGKDPLHFGEIIISEYEDHNAAFVNYKPLSGKPHTITIDEMEAQDKFAFVIIRNRTIEQAHTKVLNGGRLSWSYQPLFSIPDANGGNTVMVEWGDPQIFGFEDALDADHDDIIIHVEGASASLNDSDKIDPASLVGQRKELFSEITNHIQSNDTGDKAVSPTPPDSFQPSDGLAAEPSAVLEDSVSIEEARLPFIESIEETPAFQLDELPERPTEQPALFIAARPTKLERVEVSEAIADSSGAEALELSSNPDAIAEALSLTLVEQSSDSAAETAQVTTSAALAPAASSDSNTVIASSLALSDSNRTMTVSELMSDVLEGLKLSLSGLSALGGTADPVERLWSGTLGESAEVVIYQSTQQALVVVVATDLTQAAPLHKQLALLQNILTQGSTDIAQSAADGTVVLVQRAADGTGFLLQRAKDGTVVLVQRVADESVVLVQRVADGSVVIATDFYNQLRKVFGISPPSK
ncbi:MAG: DUF4114 domain-containing protein [Cyanobacteria bacterium P01_G01_bin.54]